MDCQRQKEGGHLKLPLVPAHLARSMTAITETAATGIQGRCDYEKSHRLSLSGREPPIRTPRRVTSMAAMPITKRIMPSV